MQTVGGFSVFNLSSVADALLQEIDFLSKFFRIDDLSYLEAKDDEPHEGQRFLHVSLDDSAAGDVLGNRRFPVFGREGFERGQGQIDVVNFLKSRRGWNAEAFR